MTRMTDNELQFVALIRAAVSGGAGVTGEADWLALFALARQQKLLPILFEYARKTPAAEENAPLFAAARQQAIAQVLSQTVRTAEFAALYRALRAAGLHPLVVKGQLCSRLYPLRDHRISADDDLLIPAEELADCHAQLRKQGLATACPPEDMAGADEISYTKAGSPLYIELHRSLFNSSKNAHDDLNRFFRAVTPVEVDGFLTLPLHEHLLYPILHAYKHFVGSGIGLRLERPDAPAFLHRHAKRGEGQPRGEARQRAERALSLPPLYGAALPVCEALGAAAAARVGAARGGLSAGDAQPHRQQRLRLALPRAGANRADEILRRDGLKRRKPDVPLPLMQKRAN